MSRRATRSLLTVPVVLALALSACGGGAAERPSAEEIADGLQQILDDSGAGDALESGVVTCIAEQLEASELDDETLAAVAEGRDEQRDEDTRDDVERVTAEATTECLGA